MSFVEEFEQQWKGLTNYLVSEMLKSEGTSVPLERIENLLENEKKRWKLPGQYQCAWLNQLRAADAETARAFEAALDGVRLEQVRPAEQPSSLLVAGPAAGGAAVGFALTKLLDAAALTTAVGTVGLGVLGVMVGSNLLKQKQRAASGQDCDAYQAQLRRIGQKLSQIVARADK